MNFIISRLILVSLGTLIFLLCNIRFQCFMMISRSDWSSHKKIYLSFWFVFRVPLILLVGWSWQRSFFLIFSIKKNCIHPKKKLASIRMIKYYSYNVLLYFVLYQINARHAIINSQWSQKITSLKRQF